MPPMFFWKDWTMPYRRIWISMSGIFIFSLLFMWFSYSQGPSGIIRWERIQEQKIIETTVHSFQLGPFFLTVPGESYVIFEYLQGSDLEHNRIASCIFLAVLTVCTVLLLSVITTLDGFWYFAGMALFILFIVSLRFDVLLILGVRGVGIPGVILTLFLLASFYFKSIRPETSFTTRVLAYSCLTLVIGIFTFMFARIPFPLLHLATTAYIPAMVLTILFIIMVAHEILVSFVYIASQGGTKSLRHFILISIIYLANILITCLHEMGTIEWDFIYINLYLLLSLSAILGLWGFKLRETLYENIFSFSPFGAFFFIALATICMITVSQLLGNANDAALKVIRDIIIFSHTAFGLAFLMYFFSNFMVMMADNLQVHKVLYKPNRMPHFTFRLAGIIITLAFVFASQWRVFLGHGMAGFYNYAADLYMLQGNETFGRAFYERSQNNAFQNHRANYALAMVKASRLDFQEADYNFQLANGKQPSDFSMTNRGNLHLWLKDYFSAIRSFSEASKIKPSAALSNNLGFAYAKIHNLDSAIYYISEARTHDLTRTSAETNFFAMAAAEYLPVKTDSILNIFDSSSPAVISNAMALATLFDQDLKIKIDPVAGKDLNLYTATLLNNYLIRNASALDTTLTNTTLNIANDSINATFSEALKASLAHSLYHQGNVYKAQSILGELAYLTQSYQGKYNYIMGLWALEQGNPEMAQSYFSHAVAANYKQAKLYNAIALTEAQKINEALVAWDTVIQQGEAEEKLMADRIKKILTLKQNSVFGLADIGKFQYARYVISIDDTVVFKRLLNTFENPNYKAQALLDMSKKQYKADRIIPAVGFFNQTRGLEITDKKLYDEIRFFELRMLASRRDVINLANQINKGITFDASQGLDKMLYTALVSESEGDVETAEKNYKILGSWNPYFEDGILAAATFFRNKDPKSDKPYSILVEAIQINSNSVRLLKAYAAEASRQGFDEYAASAVQRLMELQKK